MRSCPPASTATVPVSIDRAMGGRVDAARQPRHRDETGLAEFARDLAGEFRAGRRSVARADDRRPSACSRTSSIAAHRDQRRRIVDHPQARRIIRLAERDEDARPSAARFRVRARLLATEQMRPGACAPPRRASAGRALDRGARAAIMIDQRAKGARSDILAADETQPIEPLAVGEFHTVGGLRACHGFTADCPILVSVPASRRAILARCMMKTSRRQDEEQLGFGRLSERPQGWRAWRRRRAVRTATNSG